jgi:protein phosphatase-4 regulatory subunit 3
VQQEVIEKISKLKRFNNKLLNLWIVKFYKAIIKAKDDAFVMYLIKKNLLATIVQIFIDNDKKGNLLHSAVLELFEYLIKDPIRKIGNNFLQCYSEQLFKHEEYGMYFRAFVDYYENGKTPSSNSTYQGIGGSLGSRSSIIDSYSAIGGSINRKIGSLLDDK